MQRVNGGSILCRKRKPLSNVEELLRKACTLDLVVKEIKDAINITKASSGGLKGIDYSKSKVDTSTKADICDSILATQAHVDRLTIKLQKNLVKLTEAREAVLEMAEMLPDNAPKAVIIARYFNCKTWETIAKETQYSYDSVHRLHRVAIETLIKQGAEDRAKAILERLRGI